MRPPELRAQDAGAEQRGEAQQGRADVEGDVGTARPGQQGAVRGGHAGGVPGAADVVEQQDVHLGGQLGHPLGDRARGAGGQAVLGVDEVQPAARGPGRARRPGRGVAHAVRHRQHLDVRGVPLGRLPGPVADRGHDHLGVREGMRGEGVEEFRQMVLNVRPVDDEAEFGHREGSFSLMRRVRSWFHQ